MSDHAAATRGHYRQQPPQAEGLYDPRNEHDACGVGFIVNIRGEKSHKLVLDAIQILVGAASRGVQLRRQHRRRHGVLLPSRTNC